MTLNNVETINSSPAKEKPTTKDLHQTITDTIIAQLEQGTIPWQKPWGSNKEDMLSVPKNSITGKAYRGINIPLLWVSAHNNSFNSQEWGTFIQWQSQKEAIRKGEKGSLIVYYDTFEKEDDAGEIQKIPFLKASTVFNKCQLASYEPAAEPETPIERPSLVTRLEQVETYIQHTKAEIFHDHKGARYIPGQDKIGMPHQHRFINTNSCTATEAYYSVLGHELIHWSGHEKRLNRNIKNQFGNVAYAAEELIAELGAAFLCAELEITQKPKDDHAAYIASWLKVLKQNKFAITKAAGAASKAIDYLNSLQPKG